MSLHFSAAVTGRRGRDGFTLVELMVSTAILGLLMVLLLSTVNQTQRVWTRTTTKAAQFQGARAGFEALTRNLSQATLNTYYNIDRDKDLNPLQYYRASDLHFISGKASQAKLLGGSEAEHPTHAVFFQAPLGITATMDSQVKNASLLQYRTLNSLMTAVGYYVQWGEDQTVPDFLKGDGNSSVIPKRNRYRLMEVVQPAEGLGVYALKSYAPQAPYTKTTDWIQACLGRINQPDNRTKQDSSRVLAENVVALIIQPKDSATDQKANPGLVRLASKYEYDSRPADAAGNLKTRTGLSPEEKRQQNQLPPVVSVIMVAIDELSADRRERFSTAAPDWSSGLFNTFDTDDAALNDLYGKSGGGDPNRPTSNSYLGRLSTPTDGGPPMSYRIYTADIVIRGAKWTAKD